MKKKISFISLSEYLHNISKSSLVYGYLSRQTAGPIMHIISPLYAVDMDYSLSVHRFFDVVEKTTFYPLLCVHLIYSI